MTSLAGILAIRNGEDLDYSWREAGASLLGVCDELVICDCDSTDGTKAAIEEWASKEARITLANFPWTNPVGTNLFWIEWLNYARQHAKSDHIFLLDADEILFEESYDEVRSAANTGKALYCYRYNFWKSPTQLIPEGECCGTKVLRCGPKNYWYPSDYPDPLGRDREITQMAENSGVKIGHYGFLRKREAFFRKAKVVQGIWAGDYDPRLAEAEKADGNWMDHQGVVPWKDNLTPYGGTHPEIIKPWLKERGFEL